METPYGHFSNHIIDQGKVQEPYSLISTDISEMALEPRIYLYFY